MASTKKKPRKNNDISVKDIGKELYDYIESTNIPISTFVRLALQEKRAKDSK